MRAAALILTLLGLAPVIVYGGLTLAFRAGAIGFATVFQQLPWLVPALGIGALAALIGGVLMFVQRAVLPGTASLVVAVAAIGMASGPVLLKQKASTVPPIHDISTDTEDPPLFVAILPLREGAQNPAEYDRKQTAQQLEAYPDLKTVLIERPYAEVFPASVQALKGEGLRVVSANAAEGRIEGVATTAWFGFKDDVVVRLVDAHGIATVVDIRSKSRVGRSDVGANAERIRAILTRIDDADR